MDFRWVYLERYYWNERCNPPESAYTGKIVYEVIVWNLVNRRKYWYTPIPVGEWEIIYYDETSMMTDIKGIKLQNKISYQWNTTR